MTPQLLWLLRQVRLALMACAVLFWLAYVMHCLLSYLGRLPCP